MKKDVLTLVFYVLFIVVCILIFKSLFQLPGDVDKEFLQEQERLTKQKSVK